MQCDLKAEQEQTDLFKLRDCLIWFIKSVCSRVVNPVTKFMYSKSQLMDTSPRSSTLAIHMRGGQQGLASSLRMRTARKGDPAIPPDPTVTHSVSNAVFFCPLRDLHFLDLINH